jgi:hypothetical protein
MDWAQSIEMFLPSLPCTKNEDIALYARLAKIQLPRHRQKLTQHYQTQNIWTIYRVRSKVWRCITHSLLCPRKRNIIYTARQGKNLLFTTSAKNNLVIMCLEQPNYLFSSNKISKSSKLKKRLFFAILEDQGRLVFIHCGIEISRSWGQHLEEMLIWKKR